MFTRFTAPANRVWLAALMRFDYFISRTLANIHANEDHKHQAKIGMTANPGG